MHLKIVRIFIDHFVSLSLYKISISIESVADRTKTVLTTLRSRRAGGENVALTQIIAKEQLRQREKLMRKSKPTEETKPVVPLKRKASEMTSNSNIKKIRPIPKVDCYLSHRMIDGFFYPI